MNEVEERKAKIEELIKQSKLGIAARETATYRRGDAELTMQDRMFMSIFEWELNYINEHGKLPTPEEGRQNLRDHGWTVTEGS